jgi:hypothetical protein
MHDKRFGDVWEEVCCHGMCAQVFHKRKIMQELEVLSSLKKNFMVAMVDFQLLGIYIHMTMTFFSINDNDPKPLIPLSLFKLMNMSNYTNQGKWFLTYSRAKWCMDKSKAIHIH